MRKVLHILTHEKLSLAEEVIAAQKELKSVELEVVFLGRNAEIDYQQLLEKIFAADSVQVW